MRLLADIVSIKLRKCPICGKPLDPSYKPFCSKHCADLDLTKWFDEAYRIPTNDTDTLINDELDD